MQTAVGIVCTALWILYAGQLLSVLNFSLAQRLGLQEQTDATDPVWRHAELWTARVDLMTLWILPMGGILMLLDHPSWPLAAVIGGGIYTDCGLRESGKALALHQQGVRTGTERERRRVVATLFALAVIGVLAIGTGIDAIL